jgi:hypothetical protein
MSLFDQYTDKENNDELLYQAIKEELKPILEEWDKKCGMMEDTGVLFMDPNRTKMIKETSKIVMQFIWRKLGMKIPDYTRMMIDNNYNIMKLEQTKKI